MKSRHVVALATVLLMIAGGCASQRPRKSDSRNPAVNTVARQQLAERNRRPSLEQLKAFEERRFKGHKLDPARWAELSRRFPKTLPEDLSAPMLIERNVGQSSVKSSHILRGTSFAAHIFTTGVVASVVRHGEESESAKSPGQTIHLKFVKATPAKIIEHQPLTGAVNVLIGNKPGGWFHKVPACRAVEYAGLYPGIRVLMEGSPGGFEYVVVCEATADLASFRVAVDGVTGLKIDEAGNLLMVTETGVIAQTSPRVVEEASGDGRSTELKGRFMIHGTNEYGFEVPGRTPGARVVIDPQVVFTSYFGGSGTEGMLGADGGAQDFIKRGFDIAFGPSGHLYVIGMTTSPDFPVTAGAMNGSSDVFVMRLDPSAPPANRLVYASFIGGTAGERGRSIAPYEDGTAYIAGHTDSFDFPLGDTAGVVQPTRQGSGGYLVRVAADGGSVERGTWLGNSSSHHPNAVVLDQSSVEDETFVYVAGSATSGPPQSTGGYQESYGGGSCDAFVAKLPLDLGEYGYHTFLGGSGRDVGMAIAVDDGYAYVAGSTNSEDFPVSEFAAQGVHSRVGSDCSGNGCFDGFATRLNRLGNQAVYSTFLGAALLGGATDDEEFLRGIAVTSEGQAVVTGGVRRAEQPRILVARLESLGGALIWGAGGGGIPPVANGDHGEDIVVDSSGRAHVVGTVRRDGLAQGIGASGHLGDRDMFYARVSDSGSADFFTYLGGGASDRGFAIAAVGSPESNFCLALAGATVSTDVQTLEPLPGGATNAGGADLLLVSLCDVDLPPLPPVKVLSPSNVDVGEQVVWTIAYQNTSDLPQAVEVFDQVPLPIVAVVGCSWAVGTNEISCESVLPPGESITIVIIALADGPCGRTVENQASFVVDGVQIDTNASTARILCPPDPPPVFVTPECGNGIVEGDEECDDNRDTCVDCRIVECAGCPCNMIDDVQCPPGYDCRQEFAGNVCDCYGIDIGGFCFGVEDCYGLWTTPQCFPED